MPRSRATLLLLFALAVGCERGPETAAPPAPVVRPSILLVTLDTTRADAIGPENAGLSTPAFSGLAASGTRFTQAYATAPQTLPSHASMMTGLYPAGHGVHENGRRLGAGVATLAEELGAAGYATAAFVSGFPLERQFGLARGFAVYDDELGSSRTERSAQVTTDRALAWLAEARSRPFFLWVHYYDPHDPYQPPEPHASRHTDAYLGEIAAMDEALGRLLAGYEARVPAAQRRIAVLGDHGESRGEHGESFHGNLLYQAVMRVPLVLAGDGVPAAVREEPVSIRRIHDTLAAWAGLEGPTTLLARLQEPAMAEAMQPYLEYGWQPQVMVVSGPRKTIRAGGLEVYDVLADPSESRDLGAGADLDAVTRQALRDYPLPTDAPPASTELDHETRQRLASLGYITSSSAAPKLRSDAPAPRQMTHLFAALDRGSNLFVQERWAEAIAVLEPLQRDDPHNFTIAVRLAVANSALEREQAAERYFARAAAIDPDSLDLAQYLGLHALRRGRVGEAAPLLERVLAKQPERLAAVAGMADVRERQGRLPEAIALLERAAALESDPAPVWLRIGELSMATGDTARAVAALERARALQGAAFDHDLELGVLYLDQRRFAEAAAALDLVPADDPRSPLALFKRAQASVLLGEPDRAERVRAAYRAADPRTRALIEREQLFQGIPLR